MKLLVQEFYFSTNTRFNEDFFQQFVEVTNLENR